MSASPSTLWLGAATTVRKVFWSVWFAAAVLTLSPCSPCGADDLMGKTSTYSVQRGDTLLDIARRFDLGFAELMAANPGVDPWLPPPDTSLLVPGQHVLPAAQRTGIVINLAELRLYFYPQDESETRSFPIGVGRAGWRTPEGRTRVDMKAIHPVWVPTPSERAENPDLPLSVPAGPDNPMGDYVLYLGWRGYAIHGTNRPYSIGRRDSHGCIRLYPEDIAWLFARVGVGTPVTVVDQRLKAGWSGGELFLEVHSGQAGADALESGQTPEPIAESEVEASLTAVAGSEAARINWETVYITVQQMRGVPVQVTSPRR